MEQNKEKREDSEVMHWADSAARKIIAEKGDKPGYVVAAGITPSGTIHMGNFREVITVDLIRRALESLSKKVRFVYSWDDYDAFRKVPVNMPEQELLNSLLRKSIADIPDTMKCHDNYARHNEAVFETDLPKLNINPEFISQSKKYKNCDYAEQIKIALENNDIIKNIMNKFRKENLDEKWLPVSIFCEKCGKDSVEKIDWENGYKVSYECDCGFKDEFDIRKKGIIKLKWRIDWPMRWCYEKVDFESGGKDHFAAGGSFDTGMRISREVYDNPEPTSIRYEFIGLKGSSQFSSSEGVITTLKEMLEIYEPELIRYLFASTRPEAEFNISFDLDVLKNYEDFDKCERIYFKTDDVKAEKEYEKQKRIYEMSAIKIPAKQPIQPGLRHLTTLIQIYEGNFDNIKKYFEANIKTEFDLQRLKTRFECTKKWLEKYSPEDFKFKVHEIPEAKLTGNEKEIIKVLKEKLEKNSYDDVSLHSEFYEIATALKIKPQELFTAVYRVLINKEKGPRLASFIITIGKDKVIKLLEKAV